MIVTEFYNGSGLGNQLFNYVMTRVLALDKGFAFGVMHPEKFKGGNLMKLDFGLPVVGGSSPHEGAPPTILPNGIEHYYCEKRVNRPDGTDIRSYDNELTNILDNTKIDGLFQGEKYFEHHKEKIREWLKVETVIPTWHTCIINFRGGEYVGVRELFLTKNYWDNAVAHMLHIHSDMRFQVVTDDIKTAKKFFPNFDISHNLKSDYSTIQSAEFLIVSNSSFAFFPAWLNINVKCIIAPKYWARHNVSDGYWACGYNIVKGWLYQNRYGVLQSYEQCVGELQQYENKK